MVFGRFRDNKRLDVQRAGLNETLVLLTTLEQSVAGAGAVREAFGEVWDAAGGIPADIPGGLLRARELGDILAERVAGARKELPAFDDAAALLGKLVESIDRCWKAFLALLMARRTILDGGSATIAPTLHPSVEDCQRAMMEIARDFHAALARHLAELVPVRADFDGPWPELLNLEKMQAGLDDIRGAMEIYSDALSGGQGALPEEATVSLMEMIARMRNSVDQIEEQRVQLAAHLAMTMMMRNAGLR